MDEKKREEIAIWRYGIIAPVLHEHRKGQMEYFRDISQKTLEVPHLGRRRYTVSALKKWLKTYRQGGFEALKPKGRWDKGKTRKIDEPLGEQIKKLLEDYPFLSGAATYRLLLSEGHIRAGDFSEQCLRNYIRDQGLRVKDKEIIGRKRFEKEHINELWIADFMHGPYIPFGPKKRKVFLGAIIDDHSRVIVGGKFFFQENSIALEILLKEAIERFGRPSVFYCDNAHIFSSSHLQLFCARLGIALVHSKPYDSPSRGKIERYFRTVRQKFFPFVRLSEIEGLEDLNRNFSLWVDKEYHKQFHHGINTTPWDRFMADLKNTPIKRVSKEELELCFLRTIKRKVKNDATISVEGLLYEVPAKYIGKQIEVRFPSHDPQDLTLYEEAKPICKLKRLDPVENATPPVQGIRFDREE